MQIKQQPNSAVSSASSPVTDQFNKTQGNTFGINSQNRRALKVTQNKRLSDDLLSADPGISTDHMLAPVKSPSEVKQFNRLFVRPAEDAFSVTAIDFNKTSAFLETGNTSYVRNTKPGLVQHQPQVDSPIGLAQRRESLGMQADAINLTFHEQHSIASKADMASVSGKQQYYSNQSMIMMSEQQLNNQMGVHHRIDSLLFAREKTDSKFNVPRIPLKLASNSSGGKQYYHPHLVAQVYGLDMDGESQVKKNFDLAKSTNNQERSYPQNLVLQQANKTAMNFVSHRPGQKSENSTNFTENQQKPSPIIVEPQKILSRDKFWYLDESIYRLKRGSEETSQRETSSTAPLQKTIEYFMNHEKSMQGQKIKVIKKFNRQVMKEAVQSIHSQINNKDHSLSGIQSSYKKKQPEQKQQSKSKQTDLFPSIQYQLNDQSKEVIQVEGDNSKHAIKFDREIADQRVFKRMHPNYYFVSKDDIEERNETYRVNVIKTANRSKFKAFFSTANSMGQTSRTSLEKQHEDPALTRFKHKFLNSNPVSSQRSQSVSKNFVNLRGQLSSDVQSNEGLSHNDAGDNQSPYHQLNKSPLSNRWKTNQLETPVYMKVNSSKLASQYQRRHNSVLNAKQQQLESQQQDGDNTVSYKNMLMKNQSQLTSQNPSPIKFKRLEDLPSYRKKEKERQDLIKWQEQELIKELKRQEDCEDMVKQFVSQLGRDTQDATDNIAKLFQRDPSSKSPIHSKQPAYMGNKKHFKMDNELSQKINSIRNMQGWDNDQKKAVGGSSTKRIIDNMSPRNESKGVAGTRLITQLDKLAVYGIFEKDSSRHMQHMQSMIKKIANGGEISEKEFEEDQSSNHSVAENDEAEESVQ